MDVSVIIVNYNTKEMTKNCIDSIFEQTSGLTFEVIVVDNASKDGSKEFFLKDERIKYVYSNQNLGFGNANNLGFPYCTGDYVFLLNSDTLLKNNAIKIFFDFAKFHKSEACLGSLLLDGNLSLTGSFGKFPTLRSMLYYVLSYNFPRIAKPAINHPEAKSSFPLEVDFITGADIFIPRKVIQDYGLFDADFFMYFEETEMQYRYSLHGIKRLIIEGPEIIHYHGFSSKTKKKNMFGSMMNIHSRIVYAKKVFSFPSFIVIYLSHWLLIPKVIFSIYPIRQKMNMLKLIVTGKRVFP